MFDCTCNTQNSLLLNQHNGDDAPQEQVRQSPSFKTEDNTGIPVEGYRIMTDGVEQ